VLSASSLILLARRRAGLSQRELARRLGKPASTIARWELGEMDPSYRAVADVVAACDLAATVRLANADDSYLGDIGAQLRLEPIERLRGLGGDHWVGLVAEVAQAAPEAILIGDAAAALQGWPLLLPAVGDVEVVLPPGAAVEDLPAGIAARDDLPGVHGFADLRRSQHHVEVDQALTVAVADPLDLLRIEDARGRSFAAGALEAVLEYRRRWPHGPPPRRTYTDAEAREAIDTWLSSHTTPTAKH
jgi:transcriptional regulator with XRE-family HTH domain